MRAGTSGDPVDSHYSERFFAAEAALVGRLQHPNVVQIFDAVPDPVAPYLVMEYVAGSTLRPYCRADQLLSLELVVEIGFKCAMALGYVYRQGLIHRDVKPANLLAVLTNGTDHRRQDERLRQRAQPRRRTARRSTASARWPTCRPSSSTAARIDCRADIYSLGAVLYHLIAGRPLFDAQVQSAMMHQIYNVKPASLIGLRAGVTPGLDEVIQKALAKQPGDRYADWDAFANALSALVTTQQVPRGQFQGVLDSERFTLLRTLEFFQNFGDVELWEVVHRAKWQRFHFGHALYRKGEEGNSFHIMAQGEVEVFRDGKKVAQLGAGTSVGEMAYLAPSAGAEEAQHRRHRHRAGDDDLVHARDA